MSAAGPSYGAWGATFRRRSNGGANGLIKVREYRSKHDLNLPVGPAAENLSLPPPADP